MSGVFFLRPNPRRACWLALTLVPYTVGTMQDNGEGGVVLESLVYQHYHAIEDWWRALSAVHLTREQCARLWSYCCAEDGDGVRRLRRWAMRVPRQALHLPQRPQPPRACGPPWQSDGFEEWLDHQLRRVVRGYDFTIALATRKTEMADRRRPPTLRISFWDSVPEHPASHWDTYAPLWLPDERAEWRLAAELVHLDAAVESRPPFAFDHRPQPR